MGLALITKLNSLIIALVIALFFLIKDKRRFFLFSLGTFFIFGVTNLVFLFIAGKEFLLGNYFYHIMKTSYPILLKAVVTLEVIKQNIFLFFFAFLSVFLKNKKLFLPTFISLTYLLSLFFLKTIFVYYFILVFPLLAIMASYCVIKLTEKMDITGKTVFIIILILFSILPFYNDYRKETRFYQSNNIGQIVDYISINSKPDDLLFGEDYSTPLIALLADRRIALDMADTNPIRFQSNITDINELVQSLRKEMPKFMIFQEIGLYSSLWDFPEIRDFTRTMCPENEFADFVFFEEGQQHFYVYSCFENQTLNDFEEVEVS